MISKIYLNFLLPMFFFALLPNSKMSVNANPNLNLTKAQKEALDEFKIKVESKLYREFMKDNDFYLLLWLRAKLFDVESAVALLDQHLQWRKDNQIDTIHEEDWSQYKKEYPTFTKGVDKTGRPIYAINFGPDWDVQKAALNGTLPKLTRWFMKGRDEIVNKIYAAQKEGKDVTQWVMVVNLEKLDILVHLCTACLPFYTDFSTSYELHYPGTMHKAMLLSASELFNTILDLIRPTFSQATNDALQVLAVPRLEWEPILFQGISRTELPLQFGGTKVYLNSMLLI